MSLPVSAQLCSPNPHGNVAEVYYEGTVIFWEPRVEYQELVLTVGGPCEDIVKVFRPGEQIFFDLREIERVTDGTYTWELRRTAEIAPAVKKALDASRASGDDSIWWELFQQGAIPAGPYVESESFTVERGEIVTPAGGEKSGGALAELNGNGAAPAATAAMSAGFTEATSDGSGGPSLATRATVLTNADGVIRNSLCVGFDCPNSPTFSDTTILLMENNTRIKFDDTSSINSFPRNDWEIEANSNLNGGASYLGFNDCGQSSQGGCATDLVFAVEAGARQNALYVESDGDVGFGTNNPVVRLHTIDGDTPTLRLEQDGSSGFAPQTWDVAGNETSFFIRDATNGSTLPFRIRPGAASNSLVIDSDDDVGVGVLSPGADIHIQDSGSSFPADHATLRLEQTTSAAGWNIRANGSTGAMEIFDDTASGSAFKLQQGAANNSFVVAAAVGGAVRVGIGDTTPSGELDVNGAIYQRGGVLHADYVFESGYELRSIDEQASFMWENGYLPAIGPRQVDEQGREVLELGSDRRGIVEELEKAHIYIEQLQKTIQELKVETTLKDDNLAKLEARLARLEASIE